jgi:hypothetical protein
MKTKIVKLSDITENPDLRMDPEYWINKNFCMPDDIARMLLWASGDSTPEKDDYDKLVEAIYQLKAIAENEKNADSWRTFYDYLGHAFYMNELDIENEVTM